MPKLTLSIEKTVVARAKRYAKQHGTSVSEMVEAYLDKVTGPTDEKPHEAPILRSLRGILKTAEIEDYRRHLRNKFK